MTRRRFAEVVRAPVVDLALACCLVAAEADPDADVDAVVAAAAAELDRLATTVLGAVTEVDRALALQKALGADAGFRGRPGDYDHLRSSLLPDVLRRRRGLPILLSVVWVAVAARAGIPAVPIALPGKVVVRVGADVFVDPSEGGVLLAHADLDRIVRELTGQPLRPEHLAPADPVELLLRVLTNVRVLMARDRTLSGVRTRLWAVELSLLLPRHPFDLRRERGALLVQLGEFTAGAAELEEWADVVAGSDPEVAEQARRDARSARARLN